ncbi:MAG: hypothetical protein IT457_20765 [Planctomycetes bacterium]|nr:hypothetical protein [Planctomycetota bacterium]
MQGSVFVMGLLVGCAAVGIPAYLFSGAEERPFEDAPVIAPVTDLSTSTDPNRLLEEIARLRAELAQLRSVADRHEVRPEEASATQPEDESGPAVADAVADATVVADNAAALDILLAELGEQLQAGLVRSRYAQSTGELAMIVMQTWMQTGSPERAFRLLQTLRIDGIDANTAHWIGNALKEKGDKALARDAFLIGLRMNPTDWSIVQALAEIDPEAGLQEQLRLTADMASPSDDLAMQKALLLLAAHRREEALAAIDSMIGAGKMQDYLWDQLVKRDPAAAVERLRKQLETASDNVDMRMRLVQALRNGGDQAAARKEIDSILAAQPANGQAVQALGELDRRAALSYLEAQVASAPSGGTWWLYGEQLLAAQRKEDAITAYWQAWQSEPNNGYQYKLLELAPERYAPQIAERARTARDDETLGDIADALWRQGRRDEARMFWEEAQQFDPTDGEWIGKLKTVREGRDPFQ